MFRDIFETLQYQQLDILHINWCGIFFHQKVPHLTIRRKPWKWQAWDIASSNLNVAGWKAYTCSGQIIATSHDLTPNGGLVREIPLFQENPGWWIMIWPDLFNLKYPINGGLSNLPCTWWLIYVSLYLCWCVEVNIYVFMFVGFYLNVSVYIYIYICNVSICFKLLPHPHPPARSHVLPFHQVKVHVEIRIYQLSMKSSFQSRKGFTRVNYSQGTVKSGEQFACPLQWNLKYHGDFFPPTQEILALLVETLFWDNVG